MTVSGADGAAQAGEPPWVGRVLDFWFRELEPADWFRGDAALDERIRAQFGALHRQVCEEGTNGLHGPRALLAAVIVVDQFSRHLFRGSPQAFASDPQARALARRILDLGLDAGMTTAQRHFVYLPFQHSEDAQDQALALRLVGALGEESWTRYARWHVEMITRFGRFPTRNRILGRESTAAEHDYLAQRGE